jgi:hypothetical protein
MLHVKAVELFWEATPVVFDMFDVDGIMFSIVTSVQLILAQ